MSSLLSSEIAPVEQALDQLHEQLLQASRTGDADAMMQAVTHLASHVEQFAKRPPAITATRGNSQDTQALETIGQRLRVLCALAQELELVHRQRLNALQAHAPNPSSRVYGSHGLMSRPLIGGRSSLTA